MIKIILISLQLLILIFIALFIVNNAFIISFEINDFIYSISSSYVFGFLFFLLVVIFLVQTSYFKLVNKFNRYRLNNVLEKQKKGYDIFTRGMVALANKDYKKASVLSLKLNKFLTNDKSLFMLLNSEVLKRTKKYEQLKITYDEMINNTTTKELGEIGLMEYYLSIQDYHHAFLYAERLFVKNPHIDKLYNNILKIIAKTSNWSQLINISKRAKENNIISNEIYYEHQSIALFEIAKIKQLDNLHESLNLMKDAIKLRKSFTPYIKFFVNLLIKDKNYIGVKKILNKSWNENPNSELRNFIIETAAKLELDIVKFISTFKNVKFQNEQNQMLKTHAFIVSKKWNDARETIKPIINENPSKEICEFMSLIELGENNNIVKSNSWKMRGENADLENCWICTISNQPQKEWSSVSNSGYFNSLEWKQIPMLYHQKLEGLKSVN